MPGLKSSTIGQRRLQDQNRKIHNMTSKRPPSPYRPSPSPAPSMDDRLRLAAFDSRMGKKERAVLDPRLKEYTGALTEAEALAKMRGDHLLNLVNRKLGEGHRRKKRHSKKKKKRHHKKSKKSKKKRHSKKRHSKKKRQSKKRHR